VVIIGGNTIAADPSRTMMKINFIRDEQARFARIVKDSGVRAD